MESLETPTHIDFEFTVDSKKDLSSRHEFGVSIRCPGSQVANSGAITMVQNMVEAMKMNGCSQLRVESMKTMVGDTNLWCEGVLEKKPFGGGMWKMKGDICWGSKSVSPLVPLWCSVLHEEHQFLYLSRRIVGLPFLMQGDSELLRPLAWTCPESCGCTSPEAAANPPAYCPRSCFAWNIHQNQRNQDSKRYDCLCWDWLNGWETGATFWSIMIRHLCPLNICDLIVKR